MSGVAPGRLLFACGASLEVGDVTGHEPGERLVVSTSPHQGHSLPQSGGRQAPCCCGCPVPAKRSGRRGQRVWFAGDRRGAMVTCKIAEVTPHPALDALVMPHGKELIYAR